jgi:hypothetical protein
MPGMQTSRTGFKSRPLVVTPTGAYQAARVRARDSTAIHRDVQRCECGHTVPALRRWRLRHVRDRGAVTLCDGCHRRLFELLPDDDVSLIEAL